MDPPETLSKTSYRFNISLIEIEQFFVRIWIQKIILMLICRYLKVSQQFVSFTTKKKIL